MNTLYKKFALLLQAILLGAALVASPTALLAGEYSVIVNAENTFSGTEEQLRNQLKRIFLKFQTSWPDKTDAKVYASPAGSPQMSAFQKSVLGMSQAELASHWLSAKQKSGETPPREVKSARIMSKLVGKYTGAFGVVDSASVDADAKNIKVIMSFGD